MALRLKIKTMEESDFDSMDQEHLDRMFKEIDNCPECDGDGYNVTSCCGDDIKGNDSDLCPSCYEHQGMETEPCENCNGTGEITKKS